MGTKVQIHHCQNPGCDLRFPVDSDSPSAGNFHRRGACPRCNGPFEITTFDLPPRQPTVLDGDTGKGVAQHSLSHNLHSLATNGAPPTRVLPPFIGILDNIRSAFNVGSIFRIADGAGLSKLLLCGITATPENPKVAKTALGAQSHLDWTYSPNILAPIDALRAEGYRLIVLESTADATSLFDPTLLAPAAGAGSDFHRTDRPLALVVGNEVSGVDPMVLSRADQIIQVPMLGTKESLNVAVAFGIAAYWLQGRRIFNTQITPQEYPA